MTKKKDHLIGFVAGVALQWHFGLIADPPADHSGKEYLAQYLPKHYRLEGDKLVRSFALEKFVRC